MDEVPATGLQPTHDDPLHDAASVISLTKHGERENCTICLCPIMERAVAVPCNHLSFDFLCLAQWLQSSACCPLCKTPVSEVEYDFRSVEDFKRYVLPRALLHAESSRSVSEPHLQPSQSPALRQRQQVYAHHLYSLHIGSNAYSGYTDFTHKGFAASTTLQAKARVFLRRELLALESSSASHGHQNSGRYHPTSHPKARQATTDYLVEYIVAVLRTHQLKSFDGRAEELVTEFISHDKSCLLLHELAQWLRSPYMRLSEWDEAVQYPAV